MKKYNSTCSFKTNDIQKETLKKMRGYNINVSKFIRDAISEKLKRDNIKLVKETTSTPLDRIIKDLEKTI